MENDNANLPAGYAKAMVEMYVNQPELFTRENIAKVAEYRSSRSGENQRKLARF